MAAFRYRVFGNGGVYAGCPSLKTAREVARVFSERLECAFVVFDHPHGSGQYGSRPVAWFLNGKEDAHENSD
jgi:hypothetical protein